jgi:predicted protein tyrosine phosphatase
MFQVHDRLYVGTANECFEDRPGWAVVHACKSPCHQRAVGYRGSLPSSHPHHLVLERERDLFLNIIDPPRPLFQRATFSTFLGFTARHWQAGAEVFIHCNQGESRAPSLAALFMARHLGALDASSFDAASRELARIYPTYFPAAGILHYLRQEWDRL